MEGQIIMRKITVLSLTTLDGDVSSSAAPGACIQSVYWYSDTSIRISNYIVLLFGNSKKSHNQRDKNYYSQSTSEIHSVITLFID